VQLKRDPTCERYSRHGGFIQDIDLFDARFFGIADKEVSGTTPNPII
jgi:acyl transferase domain-containing protein